MNVWVSLGLTMLAVPLASLGPGLGLARWLPWNSAEKLAAAFGLSCILLYVAGAAVYLMNGGPWAYRAVLVIAVGAAIVQIPLLIDWWRDLRVRFMINGWIVLMLWSVCTAASVRQISGGAWAGDWLEHFQRSRFFLDHPPTDFKFLGLYLLPARPPMMNVITSLFMGAIDKSFVTFQVAMALLNAVVILPAIFLLSLVSNKERFPRAAVLLIALTLLSPMVTENLIYPWTKLYTVAWVLASLAFYLTGWREKSMSRMVLAVALMAAGILVHYSAAIVAVVVSAHYLLGVIPWRDKRLVMKEISVSLLVTALLLGSWVGWSAHHFGLRGTLASNTTISDSQRLSTSENLAKIAANIHATLVPHPYRLSVRQWEMWSSAPFTQLSLLRDYAFQMYQPNLWFSIGSVAGLLVIAGVLWRWRGSRDPLLAHEPIDRPLAGLGFTLGLGCVILGIATHGTFDPFGVGHVVLQPLTLLGLILVAAWSGTWPLSWRVLLLVGTFVDALLGVFLNLYVQGSDTSTVALIANKQVFVTQDGTILLAGAANVAAKHLYQLQFLADLPPATNLPQLLEITLMGVGALILVSLILIKSPRVSPALGPPTVRPSTARSVAQTGPGES